MLQIITAKNRSKFDELCDSMYRDRKAVFIDRLGWGLKVCDGEREIDQFDTPDAVYVIEAEAGRHLASLRLLPTIKPHLMSDVFPFLCDGEVPRGPDIWELTRLCVNPDLSRAGPEAAARRRVARRAAIRVRRGHSKVHRRHPCPVPLGGPRQRARRRASGSSAELRGLDDRRAHACISASTTCAVRNASSGSRRRSSRRPRSAAAN